MNYQYAGLLQKHQVSNVPGPFSAQAQDRPKIGSRWAQDRPKIGPQDEPDWEQTLHLCFRCRQCLQLNHPKDLAKGFRV